MKIAVSSNDLLKALELSKGSVMSITGCGGKTSMLRLLAGKLSAGFRVAAGASTKMRVPAQGAYTGLFIGHSDLPENIESPGIYYFADEITEGKLHGISEPLAKRAAKLCDVMLIEADGSKQKPLKGWADFEPVIVSRTSVTVGVLTLKPVGHIVSEALIHRLPLFLAQSGAKTGGLIKPEHLARLVNCRDGMFKGARGRRVLFINQADNEAQITEAVQFAKDFELNADEIIIGSLKNWK